MASTAQMRPATTDPLRVGVERYYEYSLFAMIVTGFVTLAGTGKLDPVALVLVFAALGLRAYHLATRRTFTLSVRTTTRLTIGYVFFYVADFFLLSASFITATVHLVLFIMVVKMFSMERQRDDVYLAIISFLMILSSAILTVDSFFIAAFIFFLLLTVTTFVTMEMRRSYREMEKKTTPDEEIAARALGTHFATSGRTPTQRMVHSLSWTATVLVMTIALGAVAVFFILPRVSSGYLSRFASRNSFVSGFGDSVQLGEIGRIQQSDQVVMHVQFTPGIHIPANLKFRGVALDQFDGRRWSTMGWGASFRTQGLNLAAAGVLPRLSGVTRLPEPRPRDLLRYRVLMEPIGTNSFFLISTPLNVSSDIREYTVERTGNVLSSDVSRTIRIYTGISYLRNPGAGFAEGQDELHHLSRAQNLQLPDDIDPRIKKLAEDVTRDRKTTYEKALAIESYLMNNFGYTLQMFTAEGADPLAYFLFTRRQGHCEYFASSMAVMLRSIGVPARIVNGFRNGELNDITGSYVVRARNAHSWVEAYIPGFGWATFDPTPAAGTEPSVSLYSRTLLYIDAMREFWSEWVINYDFTHQNTLATTTVSSGRQLFDSARIYLRERYEELLKKLDRTAAAASSQPRRLGTRFVVFLAAALLLINVRRLLRMWRERRLASQPDKAPRLAASIWYERMVRLLGRRGMEKRPSQTPVEFVETIRDRAMKERVAGFTGHYERARFGDSGEDAAKLPELFEGLEEALKK